MSQIELTLNIHPLEYNAILTVILRLFEMKIRENMLQIFCICEKCDAISMFFPLTQTILKHFPSICAFSHFGSLFSFVMHAL